MMAAGSARPKWAARSLPSATVRLPLAVSLRPSPTHSTSRHSCRTTGTAAAAVWRSSSGGLHRRETGSVHRSLTGEPDLGGKLEFRQEPVDRLRVVKVHALGPHRRQRRLGGTEPGDVPHRLGELGLGPVQGGFECSEPVALRVQQLRLVQEAQERADARDHPGQLLIRDRQRLRAPLQQQLAEVVGGPAGEPPLGLPLPVEQPGQHHRGVAGDALPRGPGVVSLQEPIALLLVGLIVVVRVVLEVGVLRRRVANAGDHSGVAPPARSRRSGRA
jgi:hypothetical protein